MRSFEELRDECLERGQLWEDPDFPAAQASVFYHQTPPFAFEWKRPSVSDLKEDRDIIKETKRQARRKSPSWTSRSVFFVKRSRFFHGGLHEYDRITRFLSSRSRSMANHDPVSRSVGATYISVSPSGYI